jgi:hypothetical protein
MAEAKKKKVSGAVGYQKKIAVLKEAVERLEQENETQLIELLLCEDDRVLWAKERHQLILQQQALAKLLKIVFGPLYDAMFDFDEEVMLWGDEVVTQ